MDGAAIRTGEPRPFCTTTPRRTAPVAAFDKNHFWKSKMPMLSMVGENGNQTSGQNLLRVERRRAGAAV